MKAGLCYLLTFFAFVSTSCSIPTSKIPRPDVETRPSDAHGLVLQLKQANLTLDTFKGIGSVSLRYDGIPQLRERIAWIGAASPSRFRMVVLASGLPIIKLASDGTRLYLHDRRTSPNAVRKMRSSDPNLKWLIPIPIRLSELLSLLSGRIPLVAHHSVDLVSDPIDDGGRILILKKWWRVVEKIYFGEDGSSPSLVETFSWTGSLRYRARLGKEVKMGEYRIPTEIAISNGRAAHLGLNVDRYWPNTPISPAMFVLESGE